MYTVLFHGKYRRICYQCYHQKQNQQRKYDTVHAPAAHDDFQTPIQPQNLRHPPASADIFQAGIEEI